MTRVALLGLGAAAHRIHVPALRRVPGVAICGASDPAPQARARWAREHPGVALHEDAAALLDQEAPDWVLIAAPPAAHAELALLALERGAHVFCEKPFVRDVEEADRVMAAAQRAGRAVAVNLEFPRMPAFAAMLERSGSAELGPPLLFQAWQTVFDAPSRRGGWRSEGRTMEEFGSHAVHLALRVFGSLPETVFAAMPRPLPSAAQDPIDLVVLGFPEGRAASIVLDRVCRGRHRYLEARLDGERASLRASIGGRAGLSLRLRPGRLLPALRLDLAPGGLAWIEEGDRRRVLARNPCRAFAAATARHLTDVLRAVARGEEPPASAREAREVVRIVTAAYTSARTGAPVPLPATPSPPVGQ